jgi:hypothetical protein
MEAALIALIGTLVGALVTAGFGDKEQRRKEILALASFIETVSELLSGMHQKLSKGEIPTTEGNRLQQVLRDYANVIDKSRIDKKHRDELKKLLPQLKSLLTTAEFEDEIIRGVVLTYEPDSRTKLLHELQKTAARLKGMSDNLKVV